MRRADMLRLLLLVLALAGSCRGNSTPPAAHRVSRAHLAALRRQLMRDNYDYQHSASSGDDNHTAASDTEGAADQLSRSSGLAQADSKHDIFSSEQHMTWGEHDDATTSELNDKNLSPRALRRHDEQYSQHRQQDDERDAAIDQIEPELHTLESVSQPSPSSPHLDELEAFDQQEAFESQENQKQGLAMYEQVAAQSKQKSQHADHQHNYMDGRTPAPRATDAPGLPRTEHTHRNFVVTVSATNVTYKLLTLKSRDGRRRGERRILEERGPRGVALISLDETPLRALRLPRSRRQYMHAAR